MKKDKQLTARFAPADVKRIEECVEGGYATSVADFIRIAVREKCNVIGPLMKTERSQAQVVFSAE